MVESEFGCWISGETIESYIAVVHSTGIESNQIVPRAYSSPEQSRVVENEVYARRSRTAWIEEDVLGRSIG